MYSEKNDLLFEIEKWFIERYAPSEGRAIDIGSGTATYSLEIIKRGCSVTLLDISSEQNKKANDYLMSHGKMDRVDRTYVLDATHLEGINNNSFDFAVCYGMINFTIQSDIKVLSEIYRVLKPGSFALISAMSLWGYIMSSLKNGTRVGDVRAEHFQQVLQTGINFSVKPFRKLYTSDEFSVLVKNSGFEIVEITSAPVLNVSFQDNSAECQNFDTVWDRIVSIEKKASALSGLRDSGTNIIIAAHKKSY